MSDVLVIGAGQAGLATAAWLGRLAPRLDVRVLEAGQVGQSWHNRWDSLRLFTPRRFSALDGLRLDGGQAGCPSRLEFAAYLARYARSHGLAVSANASVELVTPAAAGGFEVSASSKVWRSKHVVVATGPFRAPCLPSASRQLADGVAQLHAADYRRPERLPDGPVTVVGGGDSAAQLALELARDRAVTVVSPTPPWSLPARILGLSTYHYLDRLGILRAPADGRLSAWVRARPEPVFGRDLASALRDRRIHLLPQRVTGADGRRLLLADGTSLAAGTVLWCTGFRPSYPFLQVPGALDADGQPRHHRGASPVAGLHWMGLPWQSRLDSSLVHGADADARATASRIAAELGDSAAA